MKLQHFNGGLSTRLAPQLIGINEAVVFNNIDTSSGVLKPVNKFAEVGLTLKEYAFYFEAANEWVSSSSERFYVEFQDVLYYTELDALPRMYTGGTEYQLGITAPIAKPIIIKTATVGDFSGTFRYAYTFYNSVTGAESTPIFSDELEVENRYINITQMEISSDPQVTHKNIYRIGEGITEFSLVARIDNSLASYSDTIHELNILGNDLVSADYLPAPSGLKYLTEAHNTLFGAIGDKLVFSLEGKPFAWPAFYFIDFPSTITGIKGITAGLVVFTKNRAFLITGTSPESFSKYELRGDQGCIDHSTIQKVDTGIIWRSLDGFCMTTGKRVEIISKHKLPYEELSVINAVLFKEIYYLQLSDGQILAFDMSIGEVYKTYTLGTTRLLLGNNTLYGYNGYSEFKELFASSELETFTYTSPLFIEGAFTERKHYKSIYLRSAGDISIDVYIDGELVAADAFTTTDTFEVTLPDDKDAGYSIQFSIYGTGEVHELEYKAYGGERE